MHTVSELLTIPGPVSCSFFVSVLLFVCLCDQNPAHSIGTPGYAKWVHSLGFSSSAGRRISVKGTSKIFNFYCGYSTRTFSGLELDYLAPAKP